MTENYLNGNKTVPESIAMGNYNMDSHNVHRYITKEGDVQNEGDVQIRVKKPIWHHTWPLFQNAQNVEIYWCLYVCPHLTLLMVHS